VDIITHISQLDKSKTYSYADYPTWCFEERVELIKGKVSLIESFPGLKHQLVAGNLVYAIQAHAKKNAYHCFFAPVDVCFTPIEANHQHIFSVVQPDILMVCDKEKLTDLCCVGAPDWIIEILSPASSKKDLNEKYNLYEENGVREYWVVFPDSNIINQYVLQEGVYQYINSFPQSARLAPAIFPELVVNLDEVFGK
jgi:Uma2 family endonuclease